MIAIPKQDLRRNLSRSRNNSRLRRLLLSFTTVALFPAAHGQAAQHSSALAHSPSPSLYAHPDWPQAKPTDVASIETTVRSFYEAISAGPGHTIDRNRLRSLFVPDGQIVAVIAPRKTLPADVIFRTPDQYANDSDAYTATHGFFDSCPASRVETFGLMAHVYSTYESRSHPSDKVPMARGVKSFELLRSEGRWWIVEVYWDAERPDSPLPKEFLRNSEH